MNLLFVTRKYPPSVGGMETMSFAFSKEFSKTNKTTTIAWGYSQKYLPFFLPYALIKSIYVIYTKRITNVHLGDGLLSPLGLVLQILTPAKVSVTACGLDITYSNKFYQAVVPYSLRRLNKVIAISGTTKEECLKRGVLEEKIEIIPCGVYAEDFYDTSIKRNDLIKIIGGNLGKKKVLVTVGRLVERKGVAWFVENIMPGLKNDYLYLIVGAGPDLENIQNAISKHKLVDHVLLLGKIPDAELKVIYNTADFFVMPNRKVKNDMEGFGIVAVEAASAGLTVIAPRMEGMKDAIIQSKTGYFYQPETEDEIEELLMHDPLDKKSVRNAASQFEWKNIVASYSKVLAQL